MATRSRWPGVIPLPGGGRSGRFRPVGPVPPLPRVAFCDGHVAAFGFFGGIPLSILYDNTTLAVAEIKKDGKRVRTETFTKLQSHYLFQDKFARPAKGNEKGKVEGLIGYVRRNYLVPIPRFDSFDALNAWLEEQCLKRQGDQLRGRGETIEARLMRDLDTLMALPATPYDACEQVSTSANSISMVRYRNNDYSVPVAYAIMRFGCGAMFTRSSSVVARRLSPATPVLMRKETWSLTRCTFCLCLNKRSVHWIRRCSAPGSLDTSLSHAAGLIEIAACHA